MTVKGVNDCDYISPFLFIKKSKNIQEYNYNFKINFNIIYINVFFFFCINIKKVLLGG